MRKLLLVSPNNIPQNLEGYMWLYGAEGEDYRKVWEKLERSGVRSALTPSQFSDVVAEMRMPFHQWLDHLYGASGSRWDFWALEEFSGHPFSTTVFHDVCVLEMVRRAVCEGVDKLVVVCGNDGLAKSLCLFADASGMTHESRVPSRSIRDRFISLCGYLWYILYTFAAFVLARFFRLGANRPISPDVLVETYVKLQEITPDGIRERDFVELRQWLERQGLRSAIYPIFTLKNIRELWRGFHALKKSSYPVIMQESVLRLGDLIKAWLFPFSRPAILNGSCQFRGFGILPIILFNRDRRKYSWASMDGVLRYHAAKRLSHDGIKPKMLIAWDEGQIITRCGFRGFKEWNPTTERVGVWAFLPYANWHSMCPSVCRRIHGASADKGIVSGSFSHAYYSKLLGDGGGVFVAPTKRYARLVPSVTRYMGRKEKKADVATALICLPMFVTYAVRIIATAALATLFRQVRYQVKPHPHLDMEAVKDSLAKIRVGWDFFEVVSGDLYDLLAESDVVISHESTSMVEAVCMGLPVIDVAMPYTVTLSPLDGMHESMWRCVYDREGFAVAVRWALEHPVPFEERKKRGLELAWQVGVPSSEEGMKSYLPKGSELAIV